MPLTIAGTAPLGREVLEALPATVLRLGAVGAPTAPVLVLDVQASAPLSSIEKEAPQGQEKTIQFGLTSEAGLNDGLAFPFTYPAIAVAGAVGTSSLDWLGEWAAFDLIYRIAAAIAVG